MFRMTRLLAVVGLAAIFIFAGGMAANASMSPTSATVTSMSIRTPSLGYASSAIVLHPVAMVSSPDKGGPAAACSMMSLRQRLLSRMCNPKLVSNPYILSRCTKAALAAGATAGFYVAVTTTPIDWPGIATAAGVFYGGTYFFCEIGWV